MDDVGWLSPDVTGSEISSLRSKEGKKPVRFVVVCCLLFVVCCLLFVVCCLLLLLL